MNQVAKRVKSQIKWFLKKNNDLPMEKRAPAGAETHAGDMQKLYLTAHAQCRGAAQNVKPQKYSPLWSSKNMFCHPFQLKHSVRQFLEEEETLYIKNSMEEDKTLLRGKNKASSNTHPLPPIDRWTKSSFNYFWMTHRQLHNLIIPNEITPSRANANKQHI